MAVTHMHHNPVTKWMLPLAGGISGYDKIFEHGEKMVKNAGQAVTSSRKYIEESEVMRNLKSWNSFTAAVGKEKVRMEGIQTSPAETRKSGSVTASPSTNLTSISSPTLDRAPSKPITLPTRTNTVELLGDDFGDFESVAFSTSTRPQLEYRANTNTSSLSGTTLMTTLTCTTPTNLLLDEPVTRIESDGPISSLAAPESTQPQVSVVAMNYMMTILAHEVVRSGLT